MTTPLRAPVEYTRVVLPSIGGVDGSDYINANYIKVREGKGEERGREEGGQEGRRGWRERERDRGKPITLLTLFECT